MFVDFFVIGFMELFLGKIFLRGGVNSLDDMGYDIRDWYL